MRPHVGLEGLDLQVERGEIFGFIGPNGAGKTTTIKILMGLHRATSGTATLFGIDHRDPASRARVGFLPERPYFYQHLTARELLQFYGQLMELPSERLKRRSASLLERVDLVRFADVPLRSYSKGMLQRVGLCQTLLHEPELIVLDEPMSGLDPLGRALVRDLILEERERGCTVFFPATFFTMWRPCPIASPCWCVEPSGGWALWTRCWEAARIGWRCDWPRCPKPSPP